MQSGERQTPIGLRETPSGAMCQIEHEAMKLLHGEVLRLA
jgi:hypothetical protein